MRGSRWVAVSVTAALALSTAPAQATATQTRLTRLTASAAATTVSTGSTTVVAGVASPRVVGETVTLQRLVSGHWQVLGHARTTKGGRYAFSVRAAKKPASWVVRVTGKGAASKAVHLHVVKTAFHVHVTTARSVTAPSVTAPTTIVVTGSVTPRAAGKVQVQALTAGTWATVGVATLSPSSTFRVSASVKVGTSRLRVVRRFTATVAGGVSKTLTVAVLAQPGSPPTVPPTPPPATPGSPTVALSLAGTASSPGSYAAPVTVTVTAVAPAGVRSVTYSLDGGPTTAYTVPVVVSSSGQHTMVATTTDENGLVASASTAWTEHAAPVGINDDFTAGGVVSPTCQVTGFVGVLPNSGNTQCDASKIAFVAGGLRLTSTAGQLADDNQQNALYTTFDGSGPAFTVTARVVGGLGQIAANYQQIGAFFGPDQDHFVKVEAEHNTDPAPHLTMYSRDDGTNGTVKTVLPAGLATATTLDLVIKKTAGALSVFYSINGAALVQVGPSRTPVAPGAWFSSAAKAGIEVSNTGTTTALAATFSSFAVTAG